jgi:hypothetical protein
MIGNVKLAAGAMFFMLLLGGSVWLISLVPA